MIKIIKSGTIQEKHCERCGCIFSFEEEDIETEVNVGIMYGDKKPYKKFVTCPQCKNKFILKQTR